MIQQLLNLGIKRKTRVILQNEAAECGLASLAMVANYHGHVIDLSSLRTKFPLSLKGATLADIMRFASALNFQTRPLRLELDELSALKTPCILHWDLNHFVVLESVQGQHINICDPAYGRRRFSMSDASKHFTGLALELAPGMEFKPKEEKQELKLRALFGRVTGLKRSLTQILLLAAALEVFTVVTPFISQLIIDDALVSGDYQLLTVLIIGGLILALARTTVELVRSWVAIHLSTTLGLEWFSNVFAHLLRLPVPWFERRHLGDIVSRFGSLSSIQSAMTGGVIGTLLDGAMVLITLGAMLAYSTNLSLVAIAAVLAYAILRAARYGALRDASMEQLVRGAKQQSHFMETIRGVQALKLFNREQDRHQRYIALAVDSTNASLSVQKQNMVFGIVNTLIVALENSAILYLGAKLVIANQFSIGMLMAFIFYKDQFVSRISSLINTIIAFRMLSVETDRLADIVLTKPEEQVTGVSAGDLEPKLEVRNVSFRYSETEPWVLRNTSLTVSAGECVAIAGPSGCGKSTLLKIMLGQLQPNEGEVLIADIPLRQLGLKNYRSLIGVVMQDDQLFAGSLSENISFFDPHVSDARVTEAATLAAIHDDIKRMPMSYHTLAGDMGSGMSGGQKQRVFLARALYKEPKLLFMDEATSHLDVKTEQVVNQAIQKLKMTRIFIAHRQQTLDSADRVIQLPSLKSLAAVPVDESIAA